jgi:uncharacterized HAD superfamily protein
MERLRRGAGVVKPPNGGIRMLAMRVGIDVDDVVADCAAPYLRAFAKEFGLELGDAVLGWHLLDGFADVPKHKKDEFRFNLYGGPFFSELECFPDCSEALARLAEGGHELHFITARSERRRGVTEDWLARHGLLRHARAVHLRPSLDEGGGPRPASYDATASAAYKVHTARRLRLDVFCEDDPVVVRSLADAGIRVYLFDRAWNAGVAHPNVRRVRDWDEVVRDLVPACQ